MFHEKNMSDEDIAALCDATKNRNKVKGSAGDVNNCRKLTSECRLSDTSEESDDDDNDENNTNINALVVKDQASGNLDKILKHQPRVFENIKIDEAYNVHIGDVTHINGPVYINCHRQGNTEKNNKKDQVENKVLVVSRWTWLAQPAVDPEKSQRFTGPIKYVVISQSATEDPETQPENSLIVRLIQQFDIESTKLNDIRYNFLVANEGSVFEGRGWNIIGDHTPYYNHLSIGISIIGYYKTTLPSNITLKRIQALLEYGVEAGFLERDYKILTSVKPPSRLFDEVKTWARWDSSIDLDTPPND